MRNIWAWVVGVVLVGGVVVSLVKVLGGDVPDEPRRARVAVPTAPAAPKSDATMATPAPTPNATFGEVKIGDDEFVLGQPDAPVTIVEYASLTCPNCAQFHGDVLPVLKKEFIAAGKVRLVYRDFPLDRLALTAAMVARCAGRERYFGFIDAFYAGQQGWARAADPIASLAGIARLGAMAQTDFDTCLKNKVVADKVLKQRLEGEKIFEIDSTPTLIINGAKYSGGLTLDQIKAVMRPLLAKP
jgi:protein-disulfide isomerase